MRRLRNGRGNGRGNGYGVGGYGVRGWFSTSQ